MPDDSAGLASAPTTGDVALYGGLYAMRTRLLTAVFSATLAAGCAATGPEALTKIPGLTGASEVYTLTNLHPDDPRPVVSAANYQRAGLIPVCTRVTVESLDDGEMTFRIAESGRVYSYGYHKSAVEPLASHLARYFGPQCPQNEIDRLSELDRQNIADGTIAEGMTKQGVLFAIGYPPPASTNSLDRKKWRYWRNRFRSFNVEFGADGRVVRTGYDR